MAGARAAAGTPTEPVAAAGTYDASKHPHKGSGPGGGQFAETFTPAPRGALTYSGHQQGSGKYSSGGKGLTPAAPYNNPPNATLRKGRNNDPAAVMQLQHMLNELGLAGIKPDGNFGDSTEAAVKAVQAKLGMKPTGSATLALMRRLHDAHTLSPVCRPQHVQGRRVLCGGRRRARRHAGTRRAAPLLDAWRRPGQVGRIA